jgi:hypothetical protein
MSKLLPRYKRSTVYALIGVIFHFVVVVLPMIIFVGFVEHRAIQRVIGYLMLVLDFPLFLPIWWEFPTPEFIKLLLEDSFGIICYFFVFGSLLYAIAGWSIGFITDSFLQWRKYKSDF